MPLAIWPLSSLPRRAQQLCLAHPQKGCDIITLIDVRVEFHVSAGGGYFHTRQRCRPLTPENAR